jgi:hypothetical protein
LAEVACGSDITVICGRAEGREEWKGITPARRSMT